MIKREEKAEKDKRRQKNRKAEAVENQTPTKRKKTEKAKAIDEDINDD